MPVILTDAQIGALIIEPKKLPDFSKLETRPKRGHRERDIVMSRTEGGEFHLILRESNFNPLDFSVILAYRSSQSTQLFRLRRYNGKSHEHSNSIEGLNFYDFHIHQATERYQDSGFDEDTFAEVTSRYQDFSGAIRCMLDDCGLVLPSENQRKLF